MDMTAVDLLYRHFMLIFVIVICAYALYAHRRLAGLVQTGVITEKQRLSFTRGMIFVAGGSCAAVWILQILSGAQDALCFAAFPPKEVWGVGAWLIQALLSCTILWWLWVRGGADFLARVAASERGPNDGAHSARRTGLVTSAFVVLAPLGNIAVQLAQPGLAPHCAAI